MKFAKNSLVEWVSESWHADMFDLFDLGAADGMGAVDEAVQWSITLGAADLGCSFIAGELVVGLRLLRSRCS